MHTETILEDERWAGLELGALAERASRATLERLGLGDGYEISVLGCDDTRIAALNAAFREKQVPTNVLSWPSWDLSAQVAGAAPEVPSDPELGDIAIAYDTCAREAAEQGKRMQDHVTHLIVHGVLHLAGYDHIRDADATLMEGLEVEILGKLGLPDPYS